MGIMKKAGLGARASTLRRSLPITTNNNNSNIRLPLIRGRHFARRLTTTPAVPALAIPRPPRTTATFILLVSTVLRRARLLEEEEEEVSARRAGTALRSGVLAARTAWGRRPGGAGGVVARRVRE